MTILIKDLLTERAQAMAEHDADNYGPIYIVGAVNAIISDLLKARDELLAVAPAAGAEVALPVAAAPEVAPDADGPNEVPASPAEPGADAQASEAEPPSSEELASVETATEQAAGVDDEAATPAPAPEPEEPVSGADPAPAGEPQE